MTRAILPRARGDDLIVQPLPPDETLVYDKRSHKAHCLNRSAALVWQACDGQTTVQEVAERLQREVGVGSRAAAEDAVWVALDRLSRARLLQEPVAPPALAEGISRREFIRRATIAVAAGLPVVASIAAPTRAQAVTCLQSGQVCQNNKDCCSNDCVNPKSGPKVCR